MTRNQQRALLFVIGLIMMGVSYLQSGRADLTLFRYFGGIAMGLGVFFWLLEHWIWRCPPLYGLLAKPNLSGKWTGSGSETASAENDPLKRTTSTLTADQITIRQTYSSIHIAIKWQSGGESRVHEAAPYVRSGTDTKYLAFVLKQSRGRSHARFGKVDQNSLRWFCKHFSGRLGALSENGRGANAQSDRHFRAGCLPTMPRSGELWIRRRLPHPPHTVRAMSAGRGGQLDAYEMFAVMFAGLGRTWRDLAVLECAR